MFKMFKESVPLVTLILIYFRIILNIMHFIIVFQYYFSSQIEIRIIRIFYFIGFALLIVRKSSVIIRAGHATIFSFATTETQQRVKASVTRKNTNNFKGLID